MVVGAPLSIAERADRDASADATTGMNDKLHDTTARAFARLRPGFGHGHSAKTASHLAYAEIGDGPYTIRRQFFHDAADPRKIVALRPGGGDLP